MGDQGCFKGAIKSRSSLDPRFVSVAQGWWGRTALEGGLDVREIA